MLKYYVVTDLQSIERSRGTLALRAIVQGRRKNSPGQRSEHSRNGLKITPEIWRAVDELLHQKLSPEQISAKLEVSHEAIYQHIHADRSLGGYFCLHLRCQKKRRKRYAGGRERREQIIGCRPISERPANIKNRLRLGHWEGDTLIGKGHKQAIVSLVERKSGYAVLRKVPNKTSKNVGSAIINSLRPISNKNQTITSIMAENSLFTPKLMQRFNQRPTLRTRSQAGS